jgi:hypothetical protein
MRPIVVATTLTRSGGDTLWRYVARPRYSHCLSLSRRPLKRRVGQGNGRLGVNGLRPIGVFTQQSGMAASLGRPGRLHVVVE